MAEKKLTAEDAIATLYDKAFYEGAHAASHYTDPVNQTRFLDGLSKRVSPTAYKEALQALAQPAQDVRGEALEDCKRVVQNLVSGYLMEAEALKKQGAVNGATYVHTHAMGAQAAANAIAALEGNTHG
jgi:hypothetical protein